MKVRKLKKKTVFQILALLVIFASAFYLAHIAQEDESIRAVVANYGYWGVFFLAFISGFNLLVPIPAIAFMPLYIVSGLHFFSTIIIVTLGMVAADSLAFALGRLGKHLALHLTQGESRILEQLEKWRLRYPSSPLLFVFLFAAFVPLPNELVLLPLGLLGYRFLIVLPLVMGGNLIFNYLYSTGLLQVFGSL